MKFSSISLKLLFVLPVFLKVSCLDNCSSSSGINATITTGNVTFHKWNLQCSLSSTFNTTITATDITVSGLTAGNVYSFQFNCTGYNTTGCYTVATEPDVIRNLSVSGVTTSSVSLSWNSPVGSHSFYRVRWNGTQTDVQAASITLNNLIAATLYTFNITAVAMDNQTEGYYNCILQNTKPGPVSSLSVTSVTTSSVTLNWVPVNGNITSYTVQWNGSSTVINQPFGSSITTSVSGLTPGTQYTFGVAAMSGAAIGDAVWLNQSTRPGKPSNVVATNQGNSSLSISWNSPQGGVSGFAVQIASGQLNFTQNYSVSTNSITLSQLYAGIIYNVTVTSISGNFKNMSDTVQFATKPSPPGAISKVEETNSSLSLWWSKPLMDSSVQFNYSITYTSSQANQTQIVPSAQNQIQLSGLSSGTQYNVSVETVGVQDLRSDMVTQSVYTLPNPVQSLTGNEVSTTWIKLTWGSPVGVQPYYTYTVQVSNSTGLERSLLVQTTNVNVTGLQPGTKYNITVTSAASSDTFGPPQVTLCLTKPMPVDGLSATSVSSTEVRLTWTGQSYGDSTSFYLVSVSQTNFSMNTTNSGVVISDLSPGSNYTFTVITLVNMVQSVPATVFCFTIPDKATNVKAVGTTTGLTVTWDRPKGNVTSYTVTVSSSNNSNGSSTNTNQTVFNTSAVFMGLKPGQIYSIVVTTQSGPINVDSDVVQNATLPNPPTGVKFYDPSTTSVNISWVKPSNMSLGSYNFTVYYGANVASTSDTWICLGDLIPGTWYKVSVMTVGPMLYLSTADTVSGCTSLAPVTQLQAVEITTSNVTLAWEAPGSGNVYNYHITGSNLNLNLTVNSTVANIGGLQSGTNYVFNVTAVTNCAFSDAVPISLFTRPEKVTPAVSNGGTNDSITVTWNSPEGNVERYMVNVTGNQEGTLMQELNSSSQSYVMANLMAGRTYSVIVTTISGPFSEPSDPVFNATYPNKPGGITVTGKTTSSISLVWSDAPDIDYNTSFYLVEWMPAESSNALNASVNSTVLGSLASGTSYNISVTTVGPMGYKSDSAKVQLVTTQPMAVPSLEINNISAEWALLKWNKPSDFKSGYQYTVRAANSTDNVMSETVTGTVYQVNGLWPGTAYNFSVTVLTSDGTEGSPVLRINCTDEAPVMNLMCQGPNLTSAILVLTWISPKGLFTTLDLNVTGQPVDSVGACDSVCNRTIANLSYYTNYTVSLTTRGCGRSSQAVELSCRTGITVPPVPDTQAYVQVTNQVYDSFTLNLSPELFNDSAGPVVSYGVLVTSDLSGVSSQNSSLLMKYLTITYDDWNAGRKSTYLAVVKGYSGTGRSDENTVVTIGDNTEWQNYINGPLKAKGSYSFAVVLFTHLEVKDGYLNSFTSYVSISPFYQFPINLPQNPVVLASISGAVLSIVIISTIVIIAAVIFKRRKKHSNHSDVPIHSLRAKVSVPIMVENFEEYFRKQRANSNCGFAEEFENLKTVGVTQPKNSALALENKGKNRYNNVLPYDPSRVKLSVHGNPFDDYINANYMPGYNSKKEFIAAQGPLPSTVSDFWRMIWEKNVRSLVMLTRCNEQGRVKCEQYWPSGTKHFNNVSVTTTSEFVLDDWTIRDFDVKNLKTAENRYLRHFHFTAWPDHGVPETTELLISFRHLVREHMEEFSRHSPTVVHCSAGVGRTGTFIAIDRLIFQIEQESKVDVYGIVHDLRMHRPLMVQTEDQYVFLNQCALDFIRSRTGTNVDLIYQNTAALTIYENYEAMKKSKNGYHLA